MKISKTDMIRIARKEAILKIIGTMKQGEKVPARITDRQDRYFANISVRGHQLKAEFPGGVPGSNHLTLQLVKKEADSILFKLIQSSETASFKEKISDLIYLPTEKMNTLSPALLGKSLQQTSNLFELHFFLMYPQMKGRLRGEGITQILNRLLMGEISHQSLILFSSLLQGEVIPPDFLHYFLKLLQRQRREDEPNLFPSKETDLMKLLNNVMEDTDNNENDSLQRDLIKKSLEILIPKGEVTGCEVPLLIDDEFIPLKIMHNEGNWILSIELSKLGTIDILAQKEGMISIIGESREHLELIENQLREKNSDFSGIIINFKTRREALDKLVAINSFYSLNSQLDIKV